MNATRIDDGGDAVPARRYSVASPVWRLLAACLEQARDDLGRPRHRAGAAEWLASDDAAPFSFRAICEALGLEAAAVRRLWLRGAR
jgi:hypothetical protein